MHVTSKRYLSSLHALALSETHVLGEAPAVVPLTGVQPSFPPTLTHKIDDIFKVFGDVAGTAKNFIHVMDTLRTLQEERVPVSTAVEDSGRAAIAQGYRLAHTGHQGAQYISRLTHFADEFRRLLVSFTNSISYRALNSVPSFRWRKTSRLGKPLSSLFSSYLEPCL